MQQNPHKQNPHKSEQNPLNISQCFNPQFFNPQFFQSINQRFIWNKIIGLSENPGVFLEAVVQDV